MPPDEDKPNDEEKLEEEPQDIVTPFSPPDDTTQPAAGTDDDQPQAAIDSTHPATDTNIQPEEWYDEGLAGASEAQEPNAGDAVIAYRRPPGAKDNAKGDKHGDDKAA